jgi:hypothetical protein
MGNVYCPKESAGMFQAMDPVKTKILANHQPNPIPHWILNLHEFVAVNVIQGEIRRNAPGQGINSHLANCKVDIGKRIAPGVYWFFLPIAEVHFKQDQQGAYGRSKGYQSQFFKISG